MGLKEQIHQFHRSISLDSKRKQYGYDIKSGGGKDDLDQTSFACALRLGKGAVSVVDGSASEISVATAIRRELNMSIF